MTVYKYRQSVLDQLSRHGVIPTEDTTPETIREFVSDLYVFEIRVLKASMLAGQIPKADYAKTVEALRERYPILSLPIKYWTEDPTK